MAASLAAEQRRSGFYEQLFWSRSAGTLLTQLIHGYSQVPGPKHSTQSSPLQPLQFYEPFPTLTLSQMEHSSTNGPDKVALAHSHILEGTVVDVYEGELLLLVPPNQSASSRPNSQTPSSYLRLSASSTLMESDVSLSRTPSVRARATGSQIISRKLSRSQKRSSLPSLRTSSSNIADQALDYSAYFGCT